MKATLVSKTGLTDKPEYALDDGQSYLIGRSREAQVIVKDKLASRQHCKLTVTGPEEWSVADLGSSNGTYVNRQRITTRALQHGDVIQIGKAALEFRLLSATTAPTVVAPRVASGDGPRTAESSAAPAQAPPPRTPPPLPPAGGPQPPAPPKAPPAAQGPPAATEGPPPQRPPEASKAAPPPKPKASAKPPAPPRAQAPPGSPAPPEPKEDVDEDIRGLFDFLDKVGGKGGKPAADEGLPVIPVDEESPPKLREEKTPTLKLEEEVEGGGLFSLLDKVEAREPARPKAGPPPPPPQAPPPPAQSDQGGLLAFLRKKKQQP